VTPLRRGSALPILVALGAAIGVLGAYLLAGGASYRPLQAADPCESRPLAVLGERGVLEGVVLSGLDGAACELQVTREELTAALTDEAALATFTDEHGVTEDDVDSAVRAGLLRAVEDAELEGLISPAVATLARFAVENAPIAATIDAFRAIPGEPSIPEVLAALGDLGVDLSNLQGSLEDLGASGIEELDSLLQELLGRLPSEAPELPALPELPDELPRELPVEPEQLEGLLDEIQGLQP
jgi:hypothetical protein